MQKSASTQPRRSLSKSGAAFIHLFTRLLFRPAPGAVLYGEVEKLDQQRRERQREENRELNGRGVTRRLADVWHPTSGLPPARHAAARGAEVSGSQMNGGRQGLTFAQALAALPENKKNTLWARYKNGKEPCRRYQVGLCAGRDCRFDHWCAMPQCNDANRHPAKDCPNA